MGEVLVRQLACVGAAEQYAWAVQLDPLVQRASAATTLEQMFFQGEHIAHIVMYEQHRRDVLRRRGGAVFVSMAQRRRALVSPDSIIGPARAMAEQPELLSAA